MDFVKFAWQRAGTLLLSQIIVVDVLQMSSQEQKQELWLQVDLGATERWNFQ